MGHTLPPVKTNYGLLGEIGFVLFIQKCSSYFSKILRRVGNIVQEMDGVVPSGSPPTLAPNSLLYLRLVQ